jgi:hypothetical protein
VVEDVKEYMKCDFKKEREVLWSNGQL